VNNKIKILVVEDEIITAMDICNELEKDEKFICHTVTSGEKALKKLDIENPNIIIMDINIKGEINGIETVEQILLSGNKSIIFISGYATSEINERVKKLNPAGYLEKPIKISELKKIIEKEALKINNA